MNEEAPLGRRRRLAPAEGGYGYEDPGEPLAEASLEPETGPRLDLRALFSTLYRHRFLILASVFLCSIAGLGITFLMTPIYEARASLQIEQQEDRVLPGEQAEMLTPIQDADRFLQTQLDIIRSRYLAERVAQDLNLYGNDEFLAAMLVDPEEVGEAVGGRDQQRRLVMSLLDANLAVSIPVQSRIASVAFQSADPVWAARIVNSFAENAITANLQRKFDKSSYAREFLSDQLAASKQRLEDSERQLIAYARQAQLIDTSGATSGADDDAGTSSLISSTLVQLNSAYATAQAARIEAEERWNQARSISAMNLPQVLGNPAVQRLVEQRANAQALYEQERQRRKEDFPSVRQAAAQIAELDRQLSILAGNIKSSVREEYEIALARERSLANEIAGLKGERLAEQDRSVRYNILKREVDTNRQMYEGLLQRFREVSAEAGISANNLSLLDRAEVPGNPVSPNPVLNLFIAGMGGLALALLLVFVRERLDDLIRSPLDTERKLGIPALGVIPISADPQAELQEPRSAISEAYFSLRTALELSGSSGLPKSLLFTSSQPAEGKSTTSYAVARAFAGLGRRVLLIDSDLRKPSLHRVFGVRNEKGFSTALAMQQQPEEVVHRDVFPGLDFMSAGPKPPNPAELLAGNQLPSLISRLEEEYDLVLIDAPPVMGMSDVPLLASQADGAVFVVEANRSHRGQAKMALRQLAASRANILGAVLTKFDAKQVGYGSYGSYGYGYGYGYGHDAQED